MSGFASMMMYSLAIIAFVGIVVYYFLRRTRYAKETSSQQEEHKEKGNTPVRIADNISGRLYNAAISKETADKIIAEHGTLGRQWYRDNKWVYGINRYLTEEGKESFRPIPIPSLMKNDPSKLHQDIAQPEVGLWVTEFLKADKNPMLDKLWGVLPWLAGILIILFLWANA